MFANIAQKGFKGLNLGAAIFALSATQGHCGEKVLYSFQGGGDGSAPYDNLIIDEGGNFFGTTSSGGGAGCGGSGCGAVFKIAPDGTESVLYAFQGGNDGAGPASALIPASGDYFGVTTAGGGHDSGTVFKLTPGGSESVLYAFTGQSDGLGPRGNLAKDSIGNLYGATTSGGDFNGPDCVNEGCGTVFEIASDGTEKVLYEFCTQPNCADGFQPDGGVIRDSNGNLYGTTALGGTGNGDVCIGAEIGCGTVFAIAPNGTCTVLHSFQGGNDGAIPTAGLTKDAAGNYYGTTSSGGSSDQGTVFKLTPGGTETVIYTFKGGNDGSTPEANVVVDKSGNLYGTTYYGGGTHCGSTGCGTVFKLAPDGTETVLFAFHARDGRWPAASLLKGPNGQLYGTTTEGGINNNGVVFRVKK